MSETIPREIYKGGNGVKPGKYYYFCDTRKPVPYQTKRVDGKNVKDPEFDTKYLPMFKIVNKPTARSTPKESKQNYQAIRQEDPKIIKNFNLEDIIALAAGCGWRLSHKALRALRAWGKGIDEIKDYLITSKELHKDCNYLDYDPEFNQFLTKYKQQN
jgi:hypothetical protein